MGSWQEETVGGHPCDVFEPSQRNPHNHALIYLHGVHLERLVDKQPFIDQAAYFFANKKSASQNLEKNKNLENV